MPRLDRLTPAMAVLPLRLFLGATFVYAGAQKLSDPGFLHSGAPTYIGTQLHAFATGTPGGFLLRWFALPFPALAGVGVALAEIAIGLLTLLGLLTRLAAAAGLLLNLLLFLTASWHTYPYFLGSDVVFVFAWLTVLLAGPTGQPAFDTQLVTARPADGSEAGAMRVYSRQRGAHTQLDRRTFLTRALGAVAAGTLVIAGLARLVRGSYQASATLAANQSAGATRHHHTAHHHTGSTPTSHVPANAVKLGPLSALPEGQAATYRDPSDGSPDVVIRSSNGTLTAFSAICTHAGCEVGYQSGVLYCPCHGSQFSATTGAVLQGPAVTPLASRRVIQSAGELYAVPS